jgi:GTPase SAR1 family protein
MEEHGVQAEHSANEEVPYGSVEDNEPELKSLEAISIQDEAYFNSLKTQKSDYTFKIMCVGDYTGFGKKGGFVADYIHDRPLSFYHKPTIGVDFYVHFLKWKDTVKKTDFSVKLQFWDVAEHERFLNMTGIYCRNCAGALVFWGPKSPSRLSSTLRWSQKIKEANKSDRPMVLIVENIPTSKRGKPTEWIGPGKKIESREVLDRFCAKNGFLGWFELNSREGEGYNEVMKQAINCLVAKIFENTITQIP